MTTVVTAFARKGTAERAHDLKKPADAQLVVENVVANQLKQRSVQSLLGVV